MGLSLGLNNITQIFYINRSYINQFNSERYCIRLTSSNDESLCQHASPGAGPKDWAGDEIAIKHNGTLDETTMASVVLTTT